MKTLHEKNKFHKNAAWEKQCQRIDCEETRMRAELGLLLHEEEAQGGPSSSMSCPHVTDLPWCLNKRFGLAACETAQPRRCALLPSAGLLPAHSHTPSAARLLKGANDRDAFLKLPFISDGREEPPAHSSTIPSPAAGAAPPGHRGSPGAPPPIAGAPRPLSMRGSASPPLHRPPRGAGGPGRV